MARQTSPTRMTKQALVLELLRAGQTGEDVQKKTRGELIDQVRDLREETGAKARTDAAASPDAPEITDPTWPAFVLKHFVDDELEGKNPRLEGLRRVAELLLGSIAEEDCKLVQAPSPENGMRAAVKAKIVFRSQTEGGLNRIFTGLGGAGPDNCTDEFGRFPVAMAETRAKGRAFRSALRLRRVVAAEEVAGAPSNPDVADDQAIHVGQVSVLALLAERQKISLPALLAKMGIDKTDLRQLTRGEGIAVAKAINDLRMSSGPNPAAGQSSPKAVEAPPREITKKRRGKRKVKQAPSGTPMVQKPK